jgi:SAM-dependent methyltransferase
MRETGKSMLRRQHDQRFATRYFVGIGMDIGAGPDPVSLYGEFFPGLRECRGWDLPDGDAQLLAGVADNSLDFVHSSHCLEHMHDPHEALHHWFRVLKPGGHLICLLPDEDLYEQGVFPSRYNPDHKWTFTLWKGKSWSDKSISVLDMVTRLGPACQPLKIELLDGSYRYRFPRFDQTTTPIGECAIELVLRKRPEAEVTAGGRLPPPGQITREGYEMLTGQRLG